MQEYLRLAEQTYIALRIVNTFPEMLSQLELRTNEMTGPVWSQVTKFPEEATYSRFMRIRPQELEEGDIAIYNLPQGSPTKVELVRKVGERFETSVGLYASASDLYFCPCGPELKEEDVNKLLRIAPAAAWFGTQELWWYVSEGTQYLLNKRPEFCPETNRFSNPSRSSSYSLTSTNLHATAQDLCPHVSRKSDLKIAFHSNPKSLLKRKPKCPTF